ncbi:MAG: sulfurtransferase [Magnetococcales bacterium]|nr:sulfurtransferase [Magnetococcales bacterium]
MKFLKPIFITTLFCLIALGNFFILPDAEAYTLPGPMVSTQWLSQNLNNVVLLDVRRVEKDTPTPNKDSFIPGAVLVDFAKVTRVINLDGKQLKAMALDRKSFANLMSQTGVKNSDIIIITSPGRHLFELTAVTRLYWTIKYFSHNAVAILIGGNALWHSENRPLQNREKSVKKTTYQTKKANSEILANLKDVTTALQQKRQILDVRGLEYYEGEKVNKAFVSAKNRGHIPGALSLPIQSLSRQKRSAIWFQTMDEIVEIADMMDIDLNSPTILYCDSGNYASLEWFILHELLGNKKAQLYDGSMHQWSIFDKPIKQGEEP